MRRRLSIIILVIIGTIGLLNGCVSSESGQGSLNGKQLVLEDIQNEIIRFHVLANSDTEEDQKLKLKVRDKVIENMASKFIGISNIDDARKIMLDSMDEVNSIAKEVIEENGYSYGVKSELSRENFPDKMYGDTLFPQGNYEAFRILIGEANGQNWWCVMFPPLCFVDESKQAVNSDETKESLEKVIDKDKDSDKGNIIDKSKDSDQEDNVDNKQKIKFKSKLLEMLKGN
ncbi:stage II sporulation protein R [Clostridium gasigenes]|uniref:Stage II sporulation protein R n=1 Tax=Clostridium gasigenes TaxID=94869 RepID=A0A1H0VTY3_9CLOT|nr:stage II sporulation protein R [Clostridium gasigenes]MBB6622590.1 stage II sporulation protein R [Clostridium gasigenes]MBB6714189.1 stage II sporulation protein R [Clostridium gasigenes]MBU3088522.1 stage II sporulation protein R [Clostridium gasigenes]MBU3103882.1 stage II sporulation protein R [Clostridium gasigenes]MBU3132777.1 stage II sporulation protein R [Clostridium gasigenes]